MAKFSDEESFDLNCLKPNGFLYYVHKYPRSSKNFSPYNLTRTEFSRIDKNAEYYTVSRNGVTSFTQSSQPELIALEAWKWEKQIYTSLKQIKYFGTFLKWKAFSKWRKSVSAKKYDTASKSLPAKLLLVDSALRPAITMCQEICSRLQVMGLGKDFDDDPVTIGKLMEDQIDNLKEVRISVRQIRDGIKCQLVSTCKSLFERHGLPVSDCTTRPPSEEGKKGKSTELKQTLSYADQEKRKMLQERLSKFVRLVDCLLQNTLHNVLLNSFQQFVSTVEERFQSGFLDNFERMPCLCSLEILIDESGLCISPSELEVTNTLRGLFQSWEDAICAFDLFSSEPTIRQFTSGGNYPATSLGNVITSDENIAGFKTRMLQILQENFMMASDYMLKYSAVRDAYLKNIKIDQDDLGNQTDLEFFKTILADIQEQEREIEKIELVHKSGIFELHMNKLKATTEPCLQVLKQFLHALLPKIGRSKVNRLSADVQDAQAFLELVPKTTSNFVEFLQYLDRICAKLPHMQQEKEYVEELFETMKIFNITCMKEDVNSFSVFQKGLFSLQASVEKRVEKRADIVKQLEQTIQEDEKQLLGDIQAVQTAVNVRNRGKAPAGSEPALLEVESDFEEVQLVLHQLRSKLIELQKKNDNFKHQRQSFKIDNGDLCDLDAVRKTVELRQLLWDSLEIWTARLEDWDVQPFHTLDTQELSDFVNSNIEIINTVQRDLPENSVIDKYRQSVDQMGSKLPVIKYLRNENLEERHWQEMGSLVKHDLNSDQVLTLKMLEDMEVFVHFRELGRISERATCEAKLAEKLKEVSQNLHSLEFELKIHKNGYVLNKSTTFDATVDDTCIALGEIANSTFAAPIKTEVQAIRAQFNVFLETHEKMWRFQNKWYIIDAIFMPDEVSIKLPMEAKVLQEATKLWKFIMDRVYNTSSALAALNEPGVQSRVELALKMLGQIEFNLESYFDHKRMKFPRLFFLSNKEMLEMFAVSSNPKLMEKFVSKMFTSVQSIDLAEDAATNEYLIRSVQNNLGETLAFDKSVAVTRKLECWLSKLQFSIEKSLKMSISTAANDSSDTRSWLQKYPLQVLITSTMVKITRQAEESIDAEDLKKLKLKLQKEIKNYEGLLNNQELSLRTRTNIASLIPVLLNFISILEAWAKEDSADSTSFVWQKSLRLYWRDEQKEAHVKIGPSIIKCGSEFVSLDGVFVHTESSERAILSIFFSMKLGLVNMVHGERGSGKHYLLRFLAGLLAMNFVRIDCCESFDRESILKILHGTVQSGAWCCLSELGNLCVSVLSMAAQSIEKIVIASKNKSTRFTLEEREIGLNKNFCIFLTSTSKNIVSRLPRNLVKLLRPVFVPKPPDDQLLKICLRAKLGEGSEDLAKQLIQIWNKLHEDLGQKSHSFFNTRNLFRFTELSISQTGDYVESFSRIVSLNLKRRLESKEDRKTLENSIGSSCDETFEQCIADAAQDLSLVLTPALKKNVLELRDLIENGYRSVILYGDVGSGKTTTWKLYLKSLVKYGRGTSFQYKVVYPGMLNDAELSGFSVAKRWNEGIIETILRKTADQTDLKDGQVFVVLDGKIENQWLQYLGSAPNDSGHITTGKGEIFKIGAAVKFIFETTSVADAPPSILGWCGMLNIKAEPEQYLASLACSEFAILSDFRTQLLRTQVERACQEIAKIDKRGATTKVKLLVALCKTAMGLVESKNEKDVFIKALGMGLDVIKFALAEQQEEKSLDTAIDNMNDVDLLLSGDKIDEAFEQLHDKDVLRKLKLLKFAIRNKLPSVIFGATGEGKTSILKSLSESNGVDITHLLTTPVHGQRKSQFQQHLVGKLERRSLSSIGAPSGKRTHFLLDDFHQSSGSHEEFLRLALDHGAIYGDEFQWTKVEDVNFVLAADLKYENQMGPRLKRHFCHFSVKPAAENALNNIFKSDVEQFDKSGLGDLGKALTKVAINLYRSLKDDQSTKVNLTILDLLRVTVSKNKYFYLSIKTDVKETEIIRLFYTEMKRIFGSKILDKAGLTKLEKNIRNELLHELSKEQFVNSVETKKEACEITDAVFATKACSHSIELSLGEALKEHLGAHFGAQGVHKIKQFCSFDKFSGLVLDLAKALTTKPKHILIFGASGTGKRTLIKAAVELLDLRFCLIEFKRDCPDEFEWALRKLCLDSLQSKQNCVVMMVFPDFESLKSKHDVFNLIKYGQTSYFYTQEFISAALACLKDRDEEIDETIHHDMEQCAQFVSENLQKTIRFVVGVQSGPQGISQLDLANYCFVRFVDGWKIEDYEEMCIKVLKIGNYESNFSNVECIEKCLANTYLLARETYRNCQETLGCGLHAPLDMFLQYLTNFNSIYETKLKELRLKRDKCAQSIKKLDETFKLAEEMKQDLSNMVPRLKEKRVQCENVVKALSNERSLVEKMKTTVQAEETALKEKSEDARIVSIEIQRELDECLPAIEASHKALELIERNELKDVKSTNKPSSLLRLLMEPVCILLDCKPDWGSAKALAADVNFLKKAIELDKEGVPEATAKKLKEYVDNPNFLPEVMESQSKFCKTLCMWVRSIYNYVKIYRNLLPKKRRLETTESELKVAMSKLKGQQQKLADTEAKVAALEMAHDQSMAEADALHNAVESTTLRLNRAAQLATALANFDAWKSKLQEFNERIENLVGDAMLSAVAIIYCGPLTQELRKELLDKCQKCCGGFGIKSSEKFSINAHFNSLQEILSTPSTLNMWHTNKLMRDEHSVVSAIIADKSKKWPLFIDPQEQASTWIRQTHSAQGLVVLSTQKPDYLDQIRKSKSQNLPVLLQDMSETLPDGLMEILLENHCEDERTKLKIFLSTRSAKPNFGADIFTLVNVIDFAVQLEGLEDMFLNEIVRLRALDIESQLNTFGARLRAGVRDLEETNAEMQERLCQCNRDLVDDDALINSLCKSKASIDATLTNRERQLKMWKNFSDRRNQFKCVANSAAEIFNLLQRMERTNPMYKFSLQTFKDKYLEVVRKKFDLESHDSLHQSVLEFNKIAIVELVKLNLLSFDSKDSVVFLTQITTLLESKKSNIDSLNINSTDDDFEEIDKSPKVNAAIQRDNTNENCLGALMMEHFNFTPGSEKKHVGKSDFKDLVKSMKKFTPMTIMLGHDATSELRIVAQEIRLPLAEDGLVTVSLGNGQESKAEFWLRKAAQRGLWVLFQNCHLSPKWLIALDKMMHAFKADSNLVHENFRVFISTESLGSIPPVLIQSSVKFSSDILHFDPLEIKSLASRLHDSKNLKLLAEQVLKLDSTIQKSISMKNTRIQENFPLQGIYSQIILVLEYLHKNQLKEASAYFQFFLENIFYADHFMDETDRNFVLEIILGLRANLT